MFTKHSTHYEQVDAEQDKLFSAWQNGQNNPVPKAEYMYSYILFRFSYLGALGAIYEPIRGSYNRADAAYAKTLAISFFLRIGVLNFQPVTTYHYAAV